MEMLEDWEKENFYNDYEEKLHQEADKKYPNLEDRHCWQCGSRLVKGSISYYEGFHLDSCD